MNNNLLNTGIQDYINNFSSSDILSVLFQKQLFKGVSNKELVQQLEGRQKCIHKLPLWYRTSKIYYPKREALEQSSSQMAAQYKASLYSGKSLLDLTGGLGVDSYYFSQQFSSTTYCEMQEELAEIASHNFRILGADDIHVYIGDGLDFLEASDLRFDLIYLDPSRRIKSGKRVFLLEDMLPPLPESLTTIWQHTDRIMIKTSPLLDLKSGIAGLGSVRQIHIVGVENEVKEILWILEKGYKEGPEIMAVNLGMPGDQIFSFRHDEEKEAVSTYHEPKKYLYEPSASLMKAGAFSLISQRFQIDKLHPNSHLYTSDILISFPGRRYIILDVLDYKPKHIRDLGLKRAHVISRNFPEPVESIRKKFKLNEGGDRSLIFTTRADNSYICILCEKITNDQRRASTGDRAI